MRHRKHTLILDRTKSLRVALVRSLIHGLVMRGHIVTTDARARAVRTQLEKLITIARRASLHSRRLIIQRTGSADVANRLITLAGHAFSSTPGGYLRRAVIGRRKGDGSIQVRLEFTKQL